MLSLEALRLYPPPRAGLGQSQGQRTHYGLSLRHESSSEYETDSYYCEEEDSEAFGDGGPAGLATARPPPVKTVQPAGLAALLRQDSLKRASCGMRQMGWGRCWPLARTAGGLWTLCFRRDAAAGLGARAVNPLPSVTQLHMRAAGLARWRAPQLRCAQLSKSAPAPRRAPQAAR